MHHDTVNSNSKNNSQGETIQPERRNLLLGSGLALFAAGLSTAASAQDNSITAALTEDEKANIRLVDRFCKAWEAMDISQVTATMTDQCIYRQSQDTPPVTGHEAVYDLMQPWVETSHKITYKVLETFARGPVVINHRIDIYHSEDEARHLEWEGVGLFLIEDGLIREWQDFTMRIKRGHG